MTLRLLIDMNLSPSWVEVLREAGFEAAHWYHIDAPNAPENTHTAQCPLVIAPYASL